MQQYTEIGQTDNLATAHFGGSGFLAVSLPILEANNRDTEPVLWFVRLLGQLSSLMWFAADH